MDYQCSTSDLPVKHQSFKGQPGPEPEPEEVSSPSETRPESKPPIPDLWQAWVEELGGKPPVPRLTAQRRRKLLALYREQLKARTDPVGFFRLILGAVKHSDHHMSKRDYQFPESLFSSEEKRDRWALKAGRNDSGPSKYHMTAAEVKEWAGE